MLTTLKKHQLLSLALIASLSMTACGAKKDVIASPTPSAPTTGVPPQGEPQVTTDETGSTNGQMGGGLPSPYNEGDDEGPTPLPPGPTGPVPSHIKDAPPPGSDRVPDNYVSNDSGSLDSSSTKRLTGAVTSDGLVYTSSAPDDILNFLRLRNEKVSYESRQLNLEAAASVELALYSVDKMSEDAMITLKIREGNKVRVYNVSGSLSYNGPATKLRKVRFANGLETTGRRDLSGTLKCLDLDGGCENVFARLKIGTTPGAAIISVIFRNSGADVKFKLLGTNLANPEYRAIRELAVNTENGVESRNRLKAMRMNSWEVVNGRSGVSLVLLGRNKELIGFKAPLLAPEAGTGVNIRLERMRSLDESSSDLLDSEDTKLNYANYIADARLVANNGLGQVRIAIKMRKRLSIGGEVIQMTFMRRIKPIVELYDENLE